MPDDIVQEIKQRTDLVELIGQHVPLRQSGRTHRGLCPFHAEKTPSFHVDGERGFFKCYGCGKGGDCFTFLMERDGLTFHEAGEYLARRLGLAWTRRGESAEARSQRERLFDVLALAERYYCEQLRLAPVAGTYLRRRGIDEETAIAFRLGYAPPGYEALLAWLRRQKVPLDDAEAADLVLQGERGLRDRFVDRLMFPITDLEGRTIGFGGRTLQAEGVPKYLNSRETALFHKSRTLYGLHLARNAIADSGMAVVVEGYMDVIGLHQAGITNTVACLGTAIAEGHIALLRRFLDRPDHRLVLCLDGDSAGIRAALRASTMLESSGCNVYVAALPPGEDPDTFVRRHGAPALRGLLNRAVPLMEYELGMLRRKYDLAQPANRLLFVREAAQAIARSASHLTRQEYAGRVTAVLDRLADEWYQGSPAEAMSARVALRQELARLLRTARPVAPGAPDQRREREPAPEVRAAMGSRSGQYAAERYVLRAALSEPHWAELVAARVFPSYFTSPELAPLAEQLLAGCENGASAAARARRVRADPDHAVTVSDLLLDMLPLSDEVLAGHLDALEWAARRRRLEQLQALHAAGQLGDGDPRAAELLTLSRELSGRRRRED